MHRLLTGAAAFALMSSAAHAQTVEAAVADQFRQRGEIAKKLEADVLEHFVHAALCTRLTEDPTVRASAADLMFRVHMGLYRDTARAASAVQAASAEFDRTAPEKQRQFDAQIAAGQMTADDLTYTACQDERADRLLAIRNGAEQLRIDGWLP